jgi:hypothetical protein
VNPNLVDGQKGVREVKICMTCERTLEQYEKTLQQKKALLFEYKHEENRDSTFTQMTKELDEPSDSF